MSKTGEERRLGFSSEIRTYLHNPALSHVVGLVWFVLVCILISLLIWAISTGPERLSEDTTTEEN